MDYPDEEPYDCWPEAQWRSVSQQDGCSRYNLIDVSQDSVDYEELFGGDDFEFAVHDGALVVSGPIFAVNKYGTRNVFVVDGDLVVDGTLALFARELYVPLWVRGTLSAHHLCVHGDAQLFVEGDLRLGGCLVTDLSDAGHLVVHGSTSASAWLKQSTVGALYVDTEMNPIEGDALRTSLVPNLSTEDLFQQALAGGPLLRSEGE